MSDANDHDLTQHRIEVQGIQDAPAELAEARQQRARVAEHSQYVDGRHALHDLARLVIQGVG
jgi:hypothetical protein